jgi:hypothetical protein
LATLSIIREFYWDYGLEPFSLLNLEPFLEMSSVSSQPYTIGSKSFNPQQLLQDEEKLKIANAFLGKGDLHSAIITYFSLPENDSYVYHAVASVTLAQAQQAILQGDLHGLHDWYKDGEGRPVSHAF